MWIKANEGFPSGGTDVLVYTEEYDHTIAHFDVMERIWRDENDLSLAATVTHWMDLPAPPSNPCKCRYKEMIDEILKLRTRIDKLEKGDIDTRPVLLERD